MNRKDIVIGLVILAVVAAIVYFVRRPTQSPIETSQTPSIEEEIENKFNFQIPENVEKAELKDTKSEGNSGIATREYIDGKFNLTILADLPDLTFGEFYQAFLEDDEVTMSLGVLKLAKGGFMLDYTSSNDYSKYAKVVVSKQTKSSTTPENPVLEGSF